MAQQAPQRENGVVPAPEETAPSRGRLSRAWNRARRHARKLAITGIATLSLAGVFAPAAQAQTPPQTQTQTISQSVPDSALVKPDKHGKIKYEFSQARLDKIEGRMRQTQLGRDLLQFAADENIGIALSSSKVMDSNTKDNLFTKGRNYSTYILANGEMKSDDEIMVTLAHELRHSWHERMIKSGEMNVDPRHHWLMRRIQEADAFSFEVHFAYEYEKATGKELDLGDRWSACNGKAPFTCLVKEYHDARDSGKPLPEAYSQLLEKAMKHVHAMQYDKVFVGELDDGWSAAMDRPALGAQYADRFDNTVTDTEFVKEMRAVATAGLVPGTDPAALAGWTDADFLSFDKTGGRDKGDQKKLAAVEVKFGKAKDAWDKYVAEKAAAQILAEPSGTVLPPRGPGA